MSGWPAPEHRARIFGAAHPRAHGDRLPIPPTHPGGRPIALATLLLALVSLRPAALPETADAAPIPSPRSTPAADALRTHSETGMLTRSAADPRTPRGIDAICGTRLEAVTDAVRDHAARTLNEPLPTPHSVDVGNIAVLEDDGNFFYTNKGGNVIADLAAIGQSFYRTHGDDYDCLAVYLTSGLTTWLGSPSAIASALVVRNAISGIGIDPFDVGGNFGSASRLQWMLSMNGLHRYPADPYADISGDSFSTLDVLGHEFGHRWLSYAWIDSAGTPSDVLLGRAHQHWSFFLDSDASLMEGCNWTSPATDSFEIDAVSEIYGNLDLYMMGLRSGGATPPFFTLHDAVNFDPPGIYQPNSWAEVGVSCRARAHQWTVADLEALNGPRVPDGAVAPHVFRLGIILVTARGNAATPADLAEVENIRTLYEGYFATATQGFGTVDTHLDSHAGSVSIAHDPLKDRLDIDTPVPVGAHIGIDPAGIPIALDPASPRMFWRLGNAGAFNEVPMVPAAGDSFFAHIPPTPAYNGVVQYYLYAASDSVGIDAYDPPAGAATPHEFDVGPDLTTPVILHTTIPQQGQSRMPVTLLARVTDNVALSSVSVQWGVDNGALSNSTPMAPAGRDSYTVSLGNGLTEGHALRYRIVASDGSSNTGTHEAPGSQPWSVLVGRDWYFDTENGLAGVIHQPYWFSYRDAWHSSQEASSPSGGTAWKCGGDAPLPYPVHQDANLYLPLISAVEPGTFLRVTHRYDLENANNVWAWDGACIEAQVGAGPWTPIQPTLPYSHQYLVNSNPFVQGSPCWSGSSGGWRTEEVNLSALTGGTVRIRFRMLADDFFGFEGWTVDAIRVDFPEPNTAVGAPVAGASLPPWPNPASDRLQVDLTLPRAGPVEWTLFDLAGRRIADLAHGEFGAGATSLEGVLPRGLKPGVYLSRLSVAGAAARVDRIAVVR